MVKDFIEYYIEEFKEMYLFYNPERFMYELVLYIIVVTVFILGVYKFLELPPEAEKEKEQNVKN